MAATLYLIDGMSQVYRAYHAIRGLTNKEGLSTNAVYGFTTMLRKLIKEEEPQFIAVAMDVRGKTVRHDQFEDYKSNRPAMPDDLAEQLPYVLKVCQALRIPVLSYQRYEADDVIGTLVRKAEEQGMRVVIVSIDKDLFQLVSPSTIVLDPRDMIRFDAEGVRNKLGVGPEQVVDYLALVGDSSDNIPGAPGIGAKGAAQLLKEFGTLDNLLASSAEVSRKGYRESLDTNAEQIEESRSLVTIHRDLDVPLNLQDLRMEEPDTQAAVAVFTELGFNTIVPEYAQESQRAATSYNAARSRADIDRLAQRVRQEPAALVLSYADGRGASSLAAAAVSLSITDVCVLERSLIAKAADAFEGLLANGKSWIVHDLKTIWLQALSKGAPTPSCLRSMALTDAMLMAYLLDPNQKDFGLERLASDVLHQTLQSGGQLFDRQNDALAEKAAVLLELHEKLRPQLNQKGLEALLSEVELPLVEVLATMESVGVKVDVEFLRRMSAELAQEIDGLSAKIFELAGTEFNINSPRQMAEILFENLQLPLPKRTRKAKHYSTGVEVLEKLADEFEIARKILDYRELTKLKSTYLDALPLLVNPATGRIHTSYNQMVASTGRLSSSNPNLQNIPIKSDLGRRIRKGFVPEEGFRILAADYSQIELRVMAHLSEDPVLIDSFRQGEDIHARTAREVFGMNAVMDPDRFRRHAKVINFGIMYGLSAFGLAQSLNIERKEAKRFIEDYFQKYQGVQKWIDRTLREVAQRGYVATLFGRIRPIPEIRSRNHAVRSFGERTAINAPIQGTAADLIKKAMVSLHEELRRRGSRSRMILQVHDELVFEAAQDEVEELKTLVTEHMEGVAELRVPLKIDLAVGPTWFDAK